MVQRASNGRSSSNGVAYERPEETAAIIQEAATEQPLPKPRRHKEFPAEHEMYDLEVVLPGPTMQGDVLGLDYVDNGTADRLYAYAVVSVFSARVGSAASQSFFRTSASRPAAETGKQRNGKGWKALAIEDQDIVEYLDRYLFQEYADSHKPVELDPFILLAYPTDVPGLKLADAIVTQEAPFRLKSTKGVRVLADRWKDTHPALFKVQKQFDRYQRHISNPFLWGGALAGLGGLLVAALLAVTGSIFVSAAIAAISAILPIYMGSQVFTYLSRGLMARERLAKAVVDSLQEELDTGFPRSENEVSLFPGFAVKLNLTREHPMFRALIEQEELLADGINNAAVHQVFALGRRILNRLAGRGAVNSGLIMLVSAEANLNVIVPRVVADSVSSVPQYHYNDPSYKGSVFGIVMRPWQLDELRFMGQYQQAADRCTDARWNRRNPVPEHGAILRPTTGPQEQG